MHKQNQVECNDMGLSLTFFVTIRYTSFHQKQNHLGRNFDGLISYQNNSWLHLPSLVPRPNFSRTQRNGRTDARKIKAWYLLQG